MKKLVAILRMLCAFGAAGATSKTKQKPAKKAPATKSVPFTPTDGVAIKHAASEHRKGPNNVYPDVEHNPGAIDPAVTQENIAGTICNKTFKTDTIRPPSSYTTGLKTQQMAEVSA